VLPDGSGIPIAEEADKLGTATILVTAYAFRLPKRDLARYGLLLKPVRPDELLDAVKSALNAAAPPTPPRDWRDP
jgi:DNA-binding response OmpR family regulator